MAGGHHDPGAGRACAGRGKYCRPVRPAGDQRPAGDDDPAERPHLVYQPPEPHNKTAYFVDAPYQVDKISEQTFADWQHKSQAIQLQLPALNPYIPDDFTLSKSDKAAASAADLDEPTLRVVYAPSQYFASEPKADISTVLRNPQAMDSARRQVMFALNDYLAGIALDQLSNQAAVGGISFSTGANNGLMVNANGYTQHLPALFSDLLQGYFSYTPTEEQLEQAKSGMRR